MRALAVVGVCAMFLIGCQPSQPNETSIQTAIAETEAAKALLEIDTPTVTATLVPSDTPEPTRTPTPEPSPTPTPDLRIIRVDPKEFLLTKDDLPKESRFYLPNAGWISPHRNSELISQMGIEEGQRYLEETGRVDGWWGYLKRGSVIIRAPDQVFSNPVMYETAAGATQAKTGDYGLREEMEPVDVDFQIGDFTQAWVSREMQPSGKNWVTYLIDFTYRNYGIAVGGMGFEDEFDLLFVRDAALSILAKLEAAPLEAP